MQDSVPLEKVGEFHVAPNPYAPNLIMTFKIVAISWRDDWWEILYEG
jgi:hypothetical protein